MLDRTTALPPLTTDRDAALAIARVGDLMRERTRIKDEAEKTAATLAESAAASVALVTAQIAEQERLLEAFCAANRKRLLVGDAKTIVFGSGKCFWRDQPPTVRLPRAKDKLAEVIAHIKRLKLTRFLRIRIEVDKEALRKEPERARRIPGISIKDGGEKFYVAPKGLGIEEAVS